MDNSFRSFGYAANFSTVLENLVKAQNGALHCADTTLRLDSHSFCGLKSKGFKRKWVVISGEDGPKDVSSLILGLRHSPSSSDISKVSSETICSISCAKENEEESSMDLGLNFHLHRGNESIPISKRSIFSAKENEEEYSSMDLGLNFHLHRANESIPISKRPTMAAPKALGKAPVCDLQLSLSTGLSQSVITNASPVTALHQTGMEPSITIGATSLDDGSTSSHQMPESSSLLSFDSNAIEATFVHMIPNKAESQLLSTSSVMPKTPVSCSSGLTQQHNTSTKTCKFLGCGKGARGASGLCIAHGGGRRCQREGCHKGAEGRTVYCKAHGGGRRCQFLGCTKSAEGRTDYCIAHGGGRRCSHEGCAKAARGKSGLCIRHGGGKRCQKENCTKSAEGHSSLCISHGGGRRCQFPACSKGAQGSTKFCKAHGGGKRCTALGCIKGAEGSTLFCKGHGGGKRCSFQGGGVCPKSVHGGTRFCVAHGGGKRCARPECARSARGRTDFCVRHGGGKRCKFDGCGKSAQGRTDFCKAHGGGKRCLLGQVGTSIGIGGRPCDRFARGKTGLCAAHSGLVQDRCVHGGGTLGPAASQDLQHSKPEKLKDVAREDDVFHKTGKNDESVVSLNTSRSSIAHPHSNLFNLPEGRVHGGSLMAMLASGAGIDAQIGHAEKGAEYVLPRKWM